MATEGRLLIVICLIFVVLYVWQALFVKPAATRVVAPGTSTAVASGSMLITADGAAGAGETLSSGTALRPAPEFSPGAAALIGDTREREVRVETSTVIAVFTNRGGRLKSWRLKRYADEHHEPLELIATELGPNTTLPFSLEIPDAAVATTLNGALYTVRGSPTDASATPTDITFEYRDAAGLHALKEFHLEPKSYLLKFHDTVTISERPLAPLVEWGPALGIGAAQINTRYDYAPRALLSAGGKEQRLTVATLVKQPNYEDDFKYVGVEAHYFMTVAFEPGRLKVAYQTMSIPAPTGSKDAARDLVACTIDPGPRNPQLTFYVGPKDFDELGAIDRDFARAIDYGIWSFIIVPLLRSLQWIFGYVHNYGWSIVLLTVLLNIIIFPLRHKGVVAMRKMQEIQPEVKAIQERYAKLKATDPAKQKMNAELMDLYKQRNVNPAGGCIPMLLPFPLLLAFYSLLTTSIELRGAPFVFWIHDLSLPDPYYVFPVLMGVAQLWQAWTMPSAGVDPAQRRMGMIMPLVFMFAFVTSPSGIAIYWLSSTLWGVGQQYFTNYLVGPSAIRSVQGGEVDAPVQRKSSGD